jgi:hypothetical protein
MTMTVPLVHEEMHQRTRQQQQVGKDAQDVECVLVEYQRGGDQAEGKKHCPADRTPFG